MTFRASSVTMAIRLRHLFWTFFFLLILGRLFDRFAKYFVAFVVILALAFALWMVPEKSEGAKSLETKLRTRGFDQELIDEVIRSGGFDNAADFVTSVSEKPFSLLSEAKRNPATLKALKEAAEGMKEELLLEDWLREHRLSDLAPSFVSDEAFLSDVPWILDVLREEEIDFIHPYPSIFRAFDADSDLAASFRSAASKLRPDKPTLEERWKSLTIKSKKWGLNFRAFIYTIVVVFLFYFLPFIASHRRPRPVTLPGIRPSSREGIIDALTLNYPMTRLTRIRWEFDDRSRVGSTVSFQVALFKIGGIRFPLDEESARHWFFVEIISENSLVLHSASFASSPSPSSADSTPASLAPNVARVTFTVHKSGVYKITVRVAGSPVEGSPFVKEFLPGPMDLTKTALIQRTSLVTCTQGQVLSLDLQPRDEYNNKCDSKDIDGSLFSLLAEPLSYEMPLNSSLVRAEVFPVNSVFERSSRRLILKSYPHKLGIFRVTVAFIHEKINKCSFDLVVLTQSEASTLATNVDKKKHNLWYEARLLDVPTASKPRKVYVYVSPRQITVKEFYLKIFPKSLFAFRVCPSTRFSFSPSSRSGDDKVFSIDDGAEKIRLSSPHRDILVAAFADFLRKNIGGSQTFQEKRAFFNAELTKHHARHGRGKLSINVDRFDLVESSLKALKNASTADWCKLFEVTFAREEGLDWGGLRREWFTLLTGAIFKSGSGYFARFSEDRLGPVHPCFATRRPASVRAKHFEFVGKVVGKCLFESAQGPSYAQCVKARLSRSFLAQLIGLRINHKYFEQDDPDFYVSKVKYILENDLSDADSSSALGLEDLNFSEEVYDPQGHLIDVVDLISNGRNIPVTEDNKVAYLDALARYRLVTAVEEEVAAFLKGFNELIPDRLLCIFDERELELLLCGTGKIDVADLKKHTTICSSTSPMFPRVVDWFWTIVSSFGQEELALLLQFVTGSSQLPVGGFAQLRPEFQITHGPFSINALPTAHTCFNQLCLPDYEDCATFHRLLLIAIKEGSEGFALQ